MIGEQYVRLYSELHKVNGISLRFFNVYGDGQDPSSPYSGVISVFMDRAAKDEPLVVNGSGQQTRDFVSVDDVVRACLLAAGSVQRGVYNVGTGVRTTVARLAEIISDGRVRVWQGPARQGEAADSVADTNLSRLMLGFVAHDNLHDWITARRQGAGR